MKQKLVCSKLAQWRDGDCAEWSGLFVILDKEYGDDTPDEPTDVMGYVLIVIENERRDIVREEAYADSQELADAIVASDFYAEGPMVRCDVHSAEGTWDQVLSDRCDVPCYDSPLKEAR